MRKPGFTLIELLVVIAIIGLLLAVIIPSLTAVKEYSSIAACLANQKSLAQGWQMYCNENDEKFCSGYVYSDATTRNPPSWVKAPLQYDTGGNQVFVGDGDSGGLLLNPTARDNGIREGALYPYLESTDMFHCPGDKRNRKGASNNWSSSTPQRYYQIYRSYGMPDFYDVGGSGIETSAANITAAGQRLLFVEDQYDSQYYNIDGWSYIPYDHAYWDPLGNYHNKGCTFAFVDGHSEEYRWKDKRTMIFMGDRGEAAAQGFGKGDVQVGNPDFDWLDAHYPSKTRH